MDFRKELNTKTQFELVSLISNINKCFKTVEMQNYQVCTKKNIVDCLCEHFKYEDGSYVVETMSTLDDKPLKILIDVANNSTHLEFI